MRIKGPRGPPYWFFLLHFCGFLSLILLITVPFLALLEPVAIPIHLKDVGVVGNAVEERAGQAL